MSEVQCLRVEGRAVDISLHNFVNGDSHERVVLGGGSVVQVGCVLGSCCANKGEQRREMRKHLDNWLLDILHKRKTPDMKQKSQRCENAAASESFVASRAILAEHFADAARGSVARKLQASSYQLHP